MEKKRLTRCFLTGFMAFSLVTTSLGGAFAATAMAATPEETNQNSGSSDNKAIVGGVVALGLIAALAKGGDHSGSAGKTSTSGSGSTSTSGSTSASGSTSTSGTTSTGTATEEQQALTLLNADRTANGLAPLRLNSQLASLAEYYAQDMINRNFFAHNNPEGQTPFDRMKAWGINYGYAGENLAINTSVAAAEKAFMNSSGHRANILNAHYTQVGLGVRHNQKGQVYVVQEFTDG